MGKTNYDPAMSIFQQEVLKALGWQGGTIHQVIAEIEQLREIESDAIGLLINKVRSSTFAPDFCRACGAYSCTEACIRYSLTEGAQEKLRLKEKDL